MSAHVLYNCRLKIKHAKKQLVALFVYILYKLLR